MIVSVLLTTKERLAIGDFNFKNWLSPIKRKELRIKSTMIVIDGQHVSIVLNLYVLRTQHRLRSLSYRKEDMYLPLYSKYTRQKKHSAYITAF